MKNIRRRRSLFAVLCVSLMLVSIFPSVAYAEGGEEGLPETVTVENDTETGVPADNKEQGTVLEQIPEAIPEESEQEPALPAEEADVEAAEAVSADTVTDTSAPVDTEAQAAVEEVPEVVPEVVSEAVEEVPEAVEAVPEAAASDEAAEAVSADTVTETSAPVDTEAQAAVEEVPEEVSEVVPEAVPEVVPEAAVSDEAAEAVSADIVTETSAPVDAEAQAAVVEEVPEAVPETVPEETEQALMAAESNGEGAAAEQSVTYNYNASLYVPENGAAGDFPGVYSTEAILPNTVTDAKSAPTIGMPSIADKNLDTPTTESPAIIQGAAVGYEEKTGATEYKVLKDRDEPYSDYKYNVVEEKGTDGTVHKKLTGFDKTYVIVRVDVSNFFTADQSIKQYLHMKQTGNMALVPGLGMTDNGKGFADMLGNKTGSYLLSDLIDKNGSTPYIDVLLYSTGKLAAGADAGKPNALNGDVPLQLYVDNTFDYNPSLKYDPASTDPKHQENVLAKFFDAAKAAVGAISTYLIKGSDLALETSVDNSGGAAKDTGTTYWSLKKSIENPYYDLPQDTDPNDPNCGRTIKLISEVPVTEQLNLTGTSESSLKKRTLDVNSFDIQVANNTTTSTSTYSDGFYMKNAWLTIADKSNTTGAELAIGNNAKFVIDSGAKLIIDETCQLEIEWDGATTTPGAANTNTTPDILNNGMLDLRAGGEIVNNGIITIEGFEGKPYQQNTSQQVINSDKGCGEMTIEQGAKLTNNGSLMIYGKLYNLGTLVNNGGFFAKIISNDPDKGRFAYPRGIVISWKDDVTQKNVLPGALYNGLDRFGKIYVNAWLENTGDILLYPGVIENYGTIINNGNIYMGAATEAIIPIEPDPKTPTITTKRITLNPPKASRFDNHQDLKNYGIITPVSVALNDDTSFGNLTIIGEHPELFTLNNVQNAGSVRNFGWIYGWPTEVPVQPAPAPAPAPAVVVPVMAPAPAKEEEANLFAVLKGTVEKEEDTLLYLYKDNTFRMVLPDQILPDQTELTGTYKYEDYELKLTLDDEEKTEILPEKNEEDDYVYSFTITVQEEEHSFEFLLTAEELGKYFPADPAEKPAV